jgi:hypothetical protein
VSADYAGENGVRPTSRGAARRVSERHGRGHELGLFCEQATRAGLTCKFYSGGHSVLAIGMEHYHSVLCNNHPVRLNLSVRIRQPFNSIFLSQQISISISISRSAVLLQPAEQGE